MVNVGRLLNFELPRGQSAFLWGARKTGKTTWLKKEYPKSFFFDFLKTDLYIQFSKRPSLLREQILVQSEQVLKHPVILDEVQKIPQILDEVHWLIENKKISFILCGSNARKLKRGQANLLGGRAWSFKMFPLTSREIEEVNLLKALNNGLIPQHYFQDHYKRSLKAYVNDYLKEEVFSEALVRNIPAFSRFFEEVGYSHGQLINYVNIARECGVDSKTVKEYYQILEDTLVGGRVEPFKKRQNRQIISKASKFYLFDVGIAGQIIGRQISQEKGEQFGQAFEHFIYTQLVAHSSYSEIDYSINFWRTKSGLEVDFVLAGGEVAIEVKGMERVDNRQLKSLITFKEEYSPRKTIVVCNEKKRRIYKNILIIPWRDFLNELWNDKIVEL
jgi:uncharacterized protein